MRAHTCTHAHTSMPHASRTSMHTHAALRHYYPTTRAHSTPYTHTPNIHLIVRTHTTYRRTHSFLHTHHTLHTRGRTRGFVRATHGPERAAHSRQGSKTTLGARLLGVPIFRVHRPWVNCWVGVPRGGACAQSLGPVACTHTYTPGGGVLLCFPWPLCALSGGETPGVI